MVNGALLTGLTKKIRENIAGAYVVRRALARQKKKIFVAQARKKTGFLGRIGQCKAQPHAPAIDRCNGQWARPRGPPKAPIQARKRGVRQWLRRARQYVVRSCLHWSALGNRHGQTTPLTPSPPLHWPMPSQVADVVCIEEVGAWVGCPECPRPKRHTASVTGHV